MTNEQLIQWLTVYAQKVMKEKQYLSELDTPIGDGDHGMNMARGVEALLAALEKEQPTTIPDTLKLAAMTLISKVGGASGPLYGSAFLGMAQASQTTTDIALLVAAGLAQIEKRGKATVGEKTMVDVWQPVSDTLSAGESLTATQIASFVEQTKEMQATKGRASYLGERSIGHLDPGAVSSGYLFTTMLETGIGQ